jgi:hypothetical protein
MRDGPSELHEQHPDFEVASIPKRALIRRSMDGEGFVAALRSMSARSVARVEKMRGVFLNRRHDEPRARVDEGDGPDDERRHRLVAVGDRPNDGGVVWVLRDVAEVRGNAGLGEAPSEPLDQRAARPPDDLDGRSCRRRRFQLPQRTGRP